MPRAIGFRQCPIRAFRSVPSPDTKEKQPYAVALGNRGPMLRAGLWDAWKNPADGQWLRSCTIITTDADELLAPISYKTWGRSCYASPALRIPSSMCSRSAGSRHHSDLSKSAIEKSGLSRNTSEAALFASSILPRWAWHAAM